MGANISSYNPTVENTQTGKNWRLFYSRFVNAHTFNIFNAILITKNSIMRIFSNIFLVHCSLQYTQFRLQFPIIATHSFNDFQLHSAVKQKASFTQYIIIFVNLHHHHRHPTSTSTLFKFQEKSSSLHPHPLVEAKDENLCETQQTSSLNKKTNISALQSIRQLASHRRMLMNEENSKKTL